MTFTELANCLGQMGASDGIGKIGPETYYARDDCFLRIVEGSEWCTERVRPYNGELHSRSAKGFPKLEQRRFYA